MVCAEIQIRVRYAETDQMGIVYHGNFFAWFEACRIQLLDDLGMPYIDMEARGYRLPVLECQARFFAPARFDDRLRLSCVIPERPRLRFAIEYRVERHRTLIAKGKTLHAFVNPEGRPLKPPDDFLRLLHERI